MILRLQKYILLSVAVTGMLSCESMLDTEPRTSIAAGTALNTYLGVEAALNGAYAALRGPEGYTGSPGAATYYGREMVIYPELLADNVRNVNPGTCSCRGSAQLVNQAGSHLDIWEAAYAVITKSNLVIDAADLLEEASDAEKAVLKAQALFLRGYVYFDLIKTYAYNPNHIQNGFDLGVPLILEGVDDYGKVEFPERAGVTEVYAQIEKDLLQALDLFSAEGVESPASPVYATEGATHALLSRLYLYLGNDRYEDAIIQADAALSSGVGTFQETPESYVSMWEQASNPESMFELQFASTAELPQNPNDNTIQANYQQINTGTTRIGFGDIVVADNLLEEYEAGDARREVMVDYVRSDGEQVIETNKFQGSKGSFGFDNVPVIRVSEVYLNRAESYARSGNEGEALNDLNKIRNRAGLPDAEASGNELIEAILKERRLELAFEGHRFFDLTRLGRNIPKETIPAISFGDYRILAPLPLAELDVNQNLEQNPKY
ncbi:RagB/SusD family nutrient uptake outer membrane protein [Sinomicrobium soli]|uniref:RagB/SusD family nutrient uptake outer membrane protein n=1 Tax=Sinomicrobium sp. N-1-3-6 TaxID=2219864 RepID=UPI000DCC3142|nr:RagB/SusD family nutrient uptake outer membrane protein [Sinomicrobium sp. N-1-3-6]RAV28074.1 RagB/SusD family nutrient uptake outer membrane protein [Sinomicrobium sp. N-1-3-6]